MVPNRGRGVIALEDCDAGVEVERAPVITVPSSELKEFPAHLTVFDQYLLYWSDDPGAEVAMGCGLLMIYNHSSEPNVEFHSGPEPLTMSVITTRPVKAGEELVCTTTTWNSGSLPSRTWISARTTPLCALPGGASKTAPPARRFAAQHGWWSTR